jgi:hypothetical protein
MNITRVRLILALLSMALAGFALYILTNKSVPTENRDALMVALGVILGLSKDAFGFFFATSQGSSEKDHIIATQAATAKPTLDLTGAELPPAQGN